LLTKALVLSGASIAEINCVRKHISSIKGGRLAASAYPARILALAISDVPRDDISVLASGPTVADASTQHDAKRILSKYNIATPVSVASVLNDSRHESIKPGDKRLAQGETRILARGADALKAANRAATQLGFEIVLLGNDIEGDARHIARNHADVL